MEDDKIIVQCQNCGAKYRVKPPSKTKRYRCKKCQNVIVVELKIQGNIDYLKYLEENKQIQDDEKRKCAKCDKSSC